jgi:hypothetical protein
MFCRIALVVLVACLILYPVQTVEAVTGAWQDLMRWAGDLGIALVDEIADQGITIENDRFQHREMQ